MLTGIVARYVDAWNDRDADACVACFAPDAVRVWQVRAPPSIRGDPFPRFVGREAIAGPIRASIASIPDLSLEVSALSEGSDDRVWIEWRLTGTHTMAPGASPVPGEPIDFVGVSIFRVESGLIAEERAYWDTMLMGRRPAEAPAA